MFVASPSNYHDYVYGFHVGHFENQFLSIFFQQLLLLEKCDSVPDEELETLVRKMPHLEVFDYYGMVR